MPKGGTLGFSQMLCIKKKDAVPFYNCLLVQTKREENFHKKMIMTFFLKLSVINIQGKRKEKRIAVKSTAFTALFSMQFN